MQIKSELRRLLLSKRSSFTESCRTEAGNAVCENSQLLKHLNAADTVLCYISVSSELPTDGIVSYCLKNGIKLAAPVCIGENIQFRYIQSTNDLEPGLFSVPEPKAHCPSAKITPSTVCITPAVCYSGSGYRIGYGKGFYDRFFALNKCVKIGLCYEELITEFSPDENDVAVDMIVTEHGFRRLHHGQ